jgi:phage terminase large subunit-like protein
VPVRKRTSQAAPPRPWWGSGASPGERWPGVSVEIPAVWVIDRARWESPDGRFYFDMVAADTACEFFPDLLRHHIGEFAGRPFELLEYQSKLLTRPIFGWKRTADGLRRFRKVFAFLPKGAGKSPWASGTGIYLARCDGEAASEVYALANDRKQARTVHDNAKIMVEDSPLLNTGAEILKDSIFWRDTRSTFQVMSSEASSAHGKRPHGLIFDELHGFVGDHDRELYEALKKSLIKRQQPLLIIITHAGTDDEGLCHEEYEYAKSVLSGTIPDDTCLPVIFEADSKSDWTSTEVLARVHPGYGITVKRDSLATELLEAQSDPRKQNDYKRYYLNIWTNQATAWIPVDWWDACDAPMPSEEELRQYPCANATDMAQKIDLAANLTGFKLPLDDDADDTIEVVTKATAIDPHTGREVETDDVIKKVVSLDYRVALLPAFWMPEQTIQERAKQDNVRYDLWAKQNLNGQPLVFPVDGAILGADPIVRYVGGADGKGGLLKRFPRLKGGEFAYDPAFATDIALALRDGFGLTTVEVRQNYQQLSEACQVFEALVKANRIIHGGHRLLRWNLENVAIKTDDAGRIRPVKPKRATKRIDGIVAAIMVISRLMLLPPEKKKKRRAPLVWTPDGFRPIGGDTPAEHSHV